MKKKIVLICLLLLLSSCSKNEVEEKKPEDTQQNRGFLHKEVIDPVTSGKITITNVKMFPLADMENYYGLQVSLINETGEYIKGFYITVDFEKYNSKRERKIGEVGVIGSETEVCVPPCSPLVEVYGFAGSPLYFTEGEDILNKSIEIASLGYEFNRPVRGISKIQYSFQTGEVLLLDVNDEVVEKTSL